MPVLLFQIEFIPLPNGLIGLEELLDLFTQCRIDRPLFLCLRLYHLLAHMCLAVARGISGNLIH